MSYRNLTYKDVIDMCTANTECPDDMHEWIDLIVSMCILDPNNELYRRAFNELALNYGGTTRIVMCYSNLVSFSDRAINSSFNLEIPYITGGNKPWDSLTDSNEYSLTERDLRTFAELLQYSELPCFEKFFNKRMAAFKRDPALINKNLSKLLKEIYIKLVIIGGNV